jgi:hypothetical protein
MFCPISFLAPRLFTDRGQSHCYRTFYGCIQWWLDLNPPPCDAEASVAPLSYCQWPKSNLKLKTQPQQLLGFVHLAFMLLALLRMESNNIVIELLWMQ